MLFTSPQAFAFEFTFYWGDIPLCTSGHPNRVYNPVFHLQDLPEGTARIDFKLTDLQVRNYNHGGGKVAGPFGSTIEPGAFTYKSPCPPSGSHNYQWTAQAYDSGGKLLDTAQSTKRYP